MMISKSRIHTQQGVSLIEILVAVFVVSIGLLGVARMEIMAQASNNEAVQRTTATQLAQQIISKMRANPTQLSAYIVTSINSGTLSAPGVNCVSASCTPAQMAAWDLYQWQQSMAGADSTLNNNDTGGLDTPTGCISGPAGGGAGQYTVSIAWHGKTPLPDNATDLCGQGKNLYGPSDEYRRVLQLTLYIG